MKARTFVGITLFVAGILKLASIWDIIHLDWFENLFAQRWMIYLTPILLIYVGIKLLIESFMRDRDQWLRRPLPIGDEGKRIHCSVHYGADEYVYQGETFKGARLDAFCGGISMDLRKAVITEDEEIDIHTFLGGVELYVPSTVNVVVKSRSFIGGVGNGTDGNPKPNVPSLHIVASNFFGGVSIKDVEAKKIS